MGFPARCAFHILVLVVALSATQLLAACDQQLATSGNSGQGQQGRSRLGIGRGSDQPPTNGTLVRSLGFDSTVPVKRGVLRDAVTVPGTVVSGRVAQLSFRVPGTVSRIRVRPGDTVHRGDPLVEAIVDETAVRQASNEATLAELAYESQLARVQALRAGTAPDQIAAAQAAVSRAEVSVREAETARRLVESRTQDPEIALGLLAMEQALEDAALARTAVERAQVQAGLDLTASANAVRLAQRRVTEATMALEQAKAAQADASAARELTLAEMRLEQARADLQDARATEERVRRTTSREVDVAKANEQRVRETVTAELEEARASAERSRAQAALELDQAHAALQRARLAQPGPGRTSAQIDDAIAAAQEAVRLAEQRVKDADARATADLAAAQRRAQAQTAAAADALRTAQDRAEAEVASAVSAVQAAQRRVEMETIALEQAAARKQTTDAANQDAVRRAQLALETANDELEAARATHRVMQQGIASRGTDPDTAAAAARAAERRATAESLRLDQTVASRADIREKLDLQLAAARDDLAAARAKLAELTRGPSASELRREEQRLALMAEQAEVARRTAQAPNLVVAPFDGVVSSVFVNVGQIVEPRTVVVGIVDPNGVSVVANATEYDVPKLQPGMPVELSFPGIADEITVGAVSTIAGAATTVGEKVLFPVQVDLATVPQALRVGMTASVTVPLKEAYNALYIPVAAVRISGSQTTVVKVLPDDKITEVPVQLGSTFGSDVQVISGLEEGDIVAVAPPSPIRAAEVPRQIVPTGQSASLSPESRLPRLAPARP